MSSCPKCGSTELRRPSLYAYLHSHVGLWSPLKNGLLWILLLALIVIKWKDVRAFVADWGRYGLQDPVVGQIFFGALIVVLLVPAGWLGVKLIWLHKRGVNLYHCTRCGTGFETGEE